MWYAFTDSQWKVVKPSGRTNEVVLKLDWNDWMFVRARKKKTFVITWGRDGKVARSSHDGVSENYVSRKDIKNEVDTHFQDHNKKQLQSLALQALSSV